MNLWRDHKIDGGSGHSEKTRDEDIARDSLVEERRA